MANKSTTNSQPGAQEKESGSPLVPQLPKEEHEEELIDEALTETFPASDPVSIPAPVDKGPAQPHDENGRARTS
jgi:hypothetical protein